MSEFPAPPPGRDPNEPDSFGGYDMSKEKQPSSLRLFFVSVTLLVVVASFIGAYKVLSEVEPQPRVASPSPVETATITQEFLDDRMAAIVRYLGRGQAEGASQITRDLLAGSDCEVLYTGWGLFETRKAALEANALFLTQAKTAFPPEAVASVGFTKAEDRKAAQEHTSSSGKFVAAGIAVLCP